MLGIEDITRVRYAAGAWGSDGRWTAGASTSATIEASVQPASGKVLATLPEGERSRDPRTVYTFEALRGASQYDGTDADRLTIDGASYEVRELTHWRSAAPIAHYEALALRVQESGTATRTDALEHIIQGVRSALKLATGLADAKVIVHNPAGGPRPALPYLAVRVVGDRIIGDAERVDSLTSGNAPRTRSRGFREATVTVFGYGDAAALYLETFRLDLDKPAVDAVIAAAGFSLSADGQTTETPTLLDTAIETRWQCDLTAIYAIEGTNETLVGADLLSLATSYTGQSGTTTGTIAVDTDP